MASNDFMIGLRINTAAAQKDVASFYSFLESQQARAAGKGAQVAQLPKNAVSGAFGDATDPTGLRKSTALQKQFIADKAKLLGLLERQAALTVQAGGGKLDKQGLPVAAGARAAVTGLRGGVEASIARSLGLEELTPVLKGQLTKALNGVRTDLSTALSGLSGVDLQREFSRQASTILGTTNVDAFKATTVSAERAAAQSQNILANLTQEDQATAQSAAAARGSAVSTEAKAAADKQSAALASRLSDAQARALAVLQQSGGQLSATQLAGSGIHKRTLDSLQKNNLITQSAAGVSLTDIGRGVDTSSAQLTEANQRTVASAQAAAALQGRFATLSQEQVGAISESIGLIDRGNVALVASTEALTARAAAERKAEANSIKLNALQERALALIQAAGVTDIGQLKSLGVTAQTVNALSTRGLVQQTEGVVAPTELGAARDVPSVGTDEINRLRSIQLENLGRTVAATSQEADAASRVANATNTEASSREQQAALALESQANAVKIDAAEKRLLAQILTAGGKFSKTDFISTGGLNAQALAGLESKGLVTTGNQNIGGNTQFTAEVTDLGRARTDLPDLDSAAVAKINAALEARAQAEANQAAEATKQAANETQQTTTQQASNTQQRSADARTTSAKNREAAGAEAQASGESFFGGGGGLPPPPKVPDPGDFFDDFGDGDLESIDINAVAGAYLRLQNNVSEAAILFELSNDLFRPLFAESRAVIKLYNQAIETSTLRFIASNEGLLKQYGGEAAFQKTYKSQLDAATELEFANNEPLRTEQTEASATANAYRKLRKSLEELAIVNTGLTKEVIESMTNHQIVQAALGREAAASEGLIAATAGNTQAQNQRKVAELKAYLGLPGTPELEAELQTLRDQRRALRTQTQKTGFAGLTQRLGYDRTAGSTPREFFGGGALASLRYGLPSLLLYSGLSGIAKTTKEAEELNYALSVLEGQFEATFEGQDFGPVRQQIIDVAKDTGLAADELALLRVQLTGAFGNEEIDGLGGAQLIEQQTEAAAKLAQTVKLPLEEITDGLTAASLAFGASFERIGDVAVRLEEKSGVLAKETVSFIGDIAPVAEEAGYSVEEFAALAAVAQQRSGRSGAALAEAFGRVVPEITKQKEALLDLASTEDALANAGFIDAIRASDPRRILEQIGSAYGQVSTEGQQQITQILGGRREAQVIIPVITNQDAVDEFTREAENSAGALDRRYAKVRETLTNTFQRLSEQVRELVITLLDSGITDTLETVAGILGKIAGILTPMLGIVGGVNSALAGWPIHILAAFAAYKTFAAFRAADDTRRGAFANGVARIPGRIGGNFNAGFQSSLISQFGPAGQGGLARFAQAGAGSRLRAGGAGLLAVLGGGSVATGGLVVAAVAATAAFSAAKGQIDQVNEEVNSTVEEIDKINQEENVFDIDTSQEIRDRRVQNLDELASRLRRKYQDSAGFWERVNVELIGAQSEAEAVQIEADRIRDFDPDIAKFYDDIDLGIELDLSEKFFPKLGRRTGGFASKLNEQIIDQYGTLGDKVVDALTEGTVDFDTNLDDEEQRYVDEVAEIVGVDSEQLDLRVVQAIVNNRENVIQGVQDILNGDQEVTGGLTTTLRSQLQALLDFAAGEGQLDPNIIRDLETIDALKLTPFEETALKYEQFNEAYEAGILSFNDYVSAIAENAASRQENLNLDTDTPAGLDEILDNIKKQRDDAQKISDAILGRQEVLTKIAEELGASEDQLQFKQAVDATRNLDDPNFTDPEARLDAALQLQKARAETELRVAQEAGDLERVNQILNEGVDIDADIRGVLYSAQLIAGDDTFNEFASAYRLISSELISGLEDVVRDDLSKVYGGEFAARTKAAEGESNANLRNRAKDEIQSNIKGIVSKQVSSIREVLDQPVELILEQALTDIFEDGALEPDNLNALNAILGVVGKSIADTEGLTDTQINALYGTLDGIVQLLHFAGVSRDQILAAVTPDSANFFQRTAIKLQTSAAIGKSDLNADELKTSQLNQEADSITESFVELDKVRADANQSLVNQIEVEAAGNELVVAKSRDNIEEVNKAKARLDKALQTQRDHESDLKQAYLGLQQAYAEVAGNSVQAAILESAGVQEQLSNAIASGSDNTAGIEAQLVRANESIRQALIADQTSNYELLAAMAEARGNTIGAAQVGIAQAQFALRNARGTQNINNAKIALEQANQRLRDELIRHRAEQFDLLTAIVAGDDPLAQAQIAQAEAREALQRAIGPSELIQARIQVIEADRDVAKAMQDIRSSLFDLRQAQLDAVGDEVGSAQVAAQQARQQLQDAIANKAGAAQINSLRAQVITADKAAKDAVFNERRDEYDFLYEMGNITKSQYINYLEGLKSTLIPGTAQFRDLELAIKRLKDDISGDLQSNLPTSLALPTLYEVRRLSGTNDLSAGGTAAGPAIGYQDNRNMDVKIYVDGSMSQEQVVAAFSEAVGMGRNGQSVKLY